MNIKKTSVTKSTYTIDFNDDEMAVLWQALKSFECQSCQVTQQMGSRMADRVQAGIEAKT